MEGGEALVDDQLRSLIRTGALELLHGPERCSFESYVQPASVDLPVGTRCLLLKDKVLPFRKDIQELLHDGRVVLEERVVHPVDGILLLKNQTYLLPCARVRLPEKLHGALSPKSSIGRVDLMVRGVFDQSGLYDTVHGEGQLWLEVSPRSFNVRLRPGTALSQMMIFQACNPPRAVDLAREHEHEPLVLDARARALPLHTHRGALVLSLNLDVPDSDAMGFEALPTSSVVDLDQCDALSPSEHFRPLVRTGGAVRSLTLEKDKFYILSTIERISVPPHLSAEMIPFSHHVGELRAHYAGFFDPGFGYSKGISAGAAAVLEVRPHETITVYHGQPICLMQFFRNALAPTKPYGQAGNSYQNQQGPKLAKFFRASDSQSSPAV